jgi:hypothetical protein
MVEQLLNQLTGGGKINAPTGATPGAGPQMGGGIMGTGGQMMQPMQGQGGLPPQLMQFLQQLFQSNQGKPQGGMVPGQGAPNIPGQMHMGIAGPTGGQGGTIPGQGSSGWGGGQNMAPGGAGGQNPGMIRPM